MQAKILVVDDEETIRYTLKRTLKREYEVTTAESGQAALTQLKQQEFDLALIDIKLEDISGIALLAKLREQSPDTVVIVLTGNGSLDTSVEALRHGAHDYLLKPCKPTNLRESVRTGLLERQQKLKQRQLMAQLNQLANNIGNLTGGLGQETATPAITPPNDLPEAPDRLVRCGALAIDTFRHIVTIDNQMLEVSPTEFDVLFYLANKSPQIVSASELVAEVQGYESELWEAKHIARQYIYRLRQKIKETIKRDDIIRTVRGQGYAINV